MIALCRDARSPSLYPLRLFAIIYNDLFRGVPIILVIYLLGFGIPGLGLPRPWNSPYIWGSLALILSYSAYVAEVYRSGIESVHESQRAAAKSLGLSHADVMRFVVLPQAIRRVIPASMNNLISLQKDVALISFVGPVEVLRQAGIEKSLLANFTPYVGAAILFLAVTVSGNARRGPHDGAPEEAAELTRMPASFNCRRVEELRRQQRLQWHRSDS